MRAEWSDRRSENVQNDTAPVHAFRDAGEVSCLVAGPDDPSTWAYVLVFAGDFPQSSHSSRITTESTPSPTDRMRWRLYVYDDATHELGGLGEGPGAFDAAAYPSLYSLEL